MDNDMAMRHLTCTQCRGRQWAVGSGYSCSWGSGHCASRGAARDEGGENVPLVVGEGHTVGRHVRGVTRDHRHLRGGGEG
jgi:hypothetical protein